MITKFTLLLLFSGFARVWVAQTEPLPADTLLVKAFSKAKETHKNVFVIFHASWCGWCHKMDTAMNDPACKPFFDANYIIVHLTILESKANKKLENPGAEALFKKHAPANSGIPFWLIYSSDGALLADAVMPDGSNTGCPASVTEVAHFLQALKKSAAMDEKTERAIFERFRKNEPVKK